jgi:RND superfamily putative drug exporter
MFERFGHLIFRRRRWVLTAAGAVVVLAVTWGTGVFGAMTSGGFENPDSESARAVAQAERTVGRQEADVVVLYGYEGRPVSDPAYRLAVEEHLAGLPTDLVRGSTTYWSAGEAPQLVSADGTKTYAVLNIDGLTDEEVMETYDALEPALRTAPDGLDVRLGGGATITSDITHQVEEDIARAEAISMPIVLVLLVLIFGGLVAASLPLAVGALAILGSFLVLRLISLVTDVSIFAVNIVTMLGLGLAIDYALFIVSRFREERRLPGATTESALVRTMATAGRTVAFSGVTVAIALASLTFFPQVFLRSMGYGGMAAVLVAMVGALTVLPALLAMLGHRVDALRVPVPRLRRRAGDSRNDGPWARLAHSVMRRPLVYVLAIVPVLLLAGAPFASVQFGGDDHRALPEGTESRVVHESLAADFNGGSTTTVDAVITFEDGTVDEAALASYVDRVEGLPLVTSATVLDSADGTAVVAVRHSAGGIDERARELVGEIRAQDAPEGSRVLVGGQAAELEDLLSSLGSTLPWMGLFIVGATMVLLFLAFGSVVLPVKAVLMNMLSLTASFGAVVWIFQEGHLSGLLGFTPTGEIQATEPILMFAMAFGLSMDYEVFLLSRVREQWDATGDNVTAVATGLQRTGKIITGAALLLVVVIGAFSTSGITFIKMIGVGLVLAILIDATIVRALLVPATMRLLGRWNWYAPPALARFWDRFGFRESSELVLPEPRGAENQDERVLV